MTPSMWSSRLTRGLFRYTSLPFKICSELGIFKYVIESLLQGFSVVVVYLMSVSIKEQYLSALEKVLNRLDKAGLRAKRETVSSQDCV